MLMSTIKPFYVMSHLNERKNEESGNTALKDFVVTEISGDLVEDGKIKVI